MTVSKHKAEELPMRRPSRRCRQSDLTSREVADRLAIRVLVDAYAHCADRRDVEGQMSLFTDNAEFPVYMDSRNPVPSQEIRGRRGAAPVFEYLNAYEATTHFNGQSTVTWGEDAATAHHFKVDGSSQSLMVASIRYLDRLMRIDGHWYFKQRKLMVGWIDTRPLGAR